MSISTQIVKSAESKVTMNEIKNYLESLEHKNLIKKRNE